MKYTTRTTALMVVPEGETLFSEAATEVRIVDEAAGEYVEVFQTGRPDLGRIAINPEEWPELRAAIDKMISECKETP